VVPGDNAEPSPAAAEPARDDTGRPSPAASPQPAAPVPKEPRRLGPITLGRRTGVVAGLVAGLLLALAWAGTGYHYGPYGDTPAPLINGERSDGRELRQMAARLRDRERLLRARLKAAAPRGVYIVIDQTHNRLYLKRDDDILLEAVCSTGSGMVLKEGSGQKRQWVFDSPRGRFEVLSRTENPVWRKPDWAFVEEGQPIPKNPAERLDYGSLGEYALYFGDGYMIHGTLYERLLGRPVSHGCIRVGRDDLRKVWAAAKLGTRIYIY
jgi:L,D-transpeptidase ErfK/SrfK